MLRRLPRLRDDTVTAEQAFGGTFHINENFSQLDAAYAKVLGQRSGSRPVTVRDLLSFIDRPHNPVRRVAGIRCDTRTVFGLHTPHHLAAGAHPDRMRDSLTSAVRNSLIPFWPNRFRTCRWKIRRAGRVSRPRPPSTLRTRWA